MSGTLCGICLQSYSSLSRHLSNYHGVRNQEEHKLLLSYGSSRYNGTLDCTVCDRENLVWLDIHLAEAHPHLSEEERESALRQAKRREIVTKLASLRLSNPDVPMVSTMDVETLDESSDEAVDLPEADETRGPRSWTPNITSTPGQPSAQKPVRTGEESPGAVSPGYLTCGHTLTETEDPNSSSGGHGSSTRPGSRGENVSAKVEEILSRLSKLELSVSSLQDQLATPTKSSGERKTFGSAQKGQLVDKKPNTACLYDVFLDDFERSRVGTRTAKKELDNAHQARSHAKRFCLFMHADLPSSARSQDLAALYQLDKLRSYPRYLARKGYAPTTIKNMLCNVVLFVKHVEASSREASKLSHRKLSEILQELKRVRADVTKTARVHQERVPRQEAWVDAGLLRGEGNSAQVRSHVSTQAGERLSAEERHQGARATCQHAHAAERFHASLPGPREPRTRDPPRLPARPTSDDGGQDSEEGGRSSATGLARARERPPAAAAAAAADDPEMTSGSSVSDDADARRGKASEARRASAQSFGSESSDRSGPKHHPIGARKKLAFQRPSGSKPPDPNPRKRKPDESSKGPASRRPRGGAAVRLPEEPGGSNAARFSAQQDPLVFRVRQSSAGKGPRAFSPAESPSLRKRKARQLEQLSSSQSPQNYPSASALSESPR